MKATGLLGAALIAATAPAAASASMSVGDFLNRAEPLMKKSKIGLIFSGEARMLLRTLGEAAERNHHQRLEAERAARRKVATCLPPKGKAEVKADELLAYLRALPPARKAQSFDLAFSGYVARKYPCRA